MLKDIEQQLNERVSAVRERIFLLTACGSFFTSGAICFFIAGTAIVIIQSTGSVAGTFNGVILSAAGLIPLIWGFIRGRRAMPGRNGVLALLDSRGHGGGLIAAMEEIGIGQWKDVISTPEIPEITYAFGRKPLIFIIARVFMLSGLLFPCMIDAPGAAHDMDVSGDVDKLREQIEVLADEAVIYGEEQQNMLAQLENMSRTARGDDPVRTWEALDHLRRSVMENAASAAENALSKSDVLSMLEKVAKSMDAASASASRSDLEGATRDMNELIEQLCKSNPGLKEMLQQCNGGKSLASCDMGKLASSCELSKQQLEKMLDKLKQCGALNQGECGSKSGGQGSSAAQSLKEFLESNCPEGTGQGLMEMCLGAPDSGGISRGGGAAPMTWRKRDLSHNEGFKEIALPPPEFSALKDSSLIGIGSGAPQADPSAAISTGNLRDIKVDKVENHSFTVHPRHRGAVQNYFKRQSE